MIDIQKNKDLAEYTSWLIGGPAELFCTPSTIEELKQALSFSQDKNIPYTILGGGSNVLVSDQGIKGLTICMRKLSHLQVINSSDVLELDVLAGTAKSEILKVFLKYKLAPALFMAGLPGDVGGGVVMNAGVAENFVPREFYEIVDQVSVLKPNGEIHEYKNSDIKWEYRHSSGWQPGIICKVKIKVKNAPVEGILEQVKLANKTRLQKQPLDLPSCGSVFVNPQGYKAAQLIDSTGLKGFKIGDAQVSEKHANFIVNKGKAKAQDVWALIKYIQSEVFKKHNVKLKTEVIRLGEWPIS